ncbi:hypothetical protein BGX28_009919 [Mortierella sp. GBA30]|nr:hypothetical protein BGX28_009919 [Mortierella sp. GBA30]
MLLAFTKIPTESDVQNALHAIQPEGDLCLRALQGDSSSSAERQFVQILTRIHELIDASSLVQLVVGVEYCSSSQQPWSARILLPHLIRGLDRFVLFSTNPDRVTRRSSELATIIAAIEQRQSEWWSLGIEGSTTIWTRVSDPSPRSPVSCQLVKSRQVALQQGLYTRAVNFETRILAVLRHQEPPQMAALQRTMARLARPYHHVLVWTRTSPTFSNPETKEDNLTSSLARQRTFLDRVLRLVQPYKLTYKDVREVSAFGNEAMRRLQTVLTELDGRTLVVAVMVDRLVRHEKHLPVLKDILTRNHSQLACILWDPQLFKTKDASDIGNDWLSNHPLPPSHELSLPILAPCIWLDVDQEQWNPNVLRHIKAAQEFCEGFRLTMFQGSSSLLIPRELLQAEGARGFSERRADAWKGHAQRFFPAAQVELPM